ncbi:DHA2 family efflux MFS transporter permease subunit [Kineosporia succinea]
MDRELVRLVGVLLLGAMAALIDTTVVSVALGDLAKVFGVDVSVVQWASTGYLLAMVAVIPLLGPLVDRFGTRRLWLGTISVFLTGSVLCSTAWSIESLIVFRVVQGLGAGLILPLVQAILAQAAGPQRIGRVMGLVGIPGQLAPVLGPVVGGLIVGSLGWRWIFLVNVPICGAALLLAGRNLESPGTTPTSRGSLLKTRSLVVGALLVFLSGACLYAPMLLTPLFFQQVRGYDVEQVGLLLAPQGIGLMVSLWFTGRWADRSGPRVVAAFGALMLALGVVTLALGARAPLSVLLTALVCMGIGLGGIGIGASAASYRDVPSGSIPRAAALVSVVQRAGASAGTVTAALVLQSGSFVRAYGWVLALIGVSGAVVWFLPSGAAGGSRSDAMREAADVDCRC